MFNKLQANLNSSLNKLNLGQPQPNQGPQPGYPAAGQPQYGQPQYPQQGGQYANVEQPSLTAPPPAQYTAPPGPPVVYQEAAPPGQLEYYTASAFGASVPKLESHNPKGTITCGDLRLTIDGELVPVVDVMLGQQMGIYFEHHILLWKSPSTSISIRMGGQGMSRFFSGMQIFQTEAHGPGNIAFSRDSVGQIVALKLAPNQTIEVREHQFLLATTNVQYSVTSFPGLSNILFSRTGLFIDTFTARQVEGLVLLHGYGNVFEKVLAPGEALDVEPGAWLWKDPTVTIQTVSVGASAGNQNMQQGGFGKIMGAIAGAVA
ncbi:hypothetical protein HK101_001818, partial [Irineochytrium annulatum]